MKFIKKILLLISLFIITFTISGCDKNREPDQPFDEFLDELFIDMLSSDVINVNFFVQNPSTYGLEDLEVTPQDVTYESHVEYIGYLKDVKETLTSYNYKNLTNDQKLSYNVVLDTLNTSLGFEDYYYYNSMLGSYLGYNAQLPIVLSEYHFYTKNDIDNYLSLLTSTKATFENYVEFEKERVEKGFGFPDYILDGIIEQCNNFVNSEDNYLIPVFNEKIEELSFLTSEEKQQYKDLNKEYIEENFIPAYIYLSNEMDKLKGKAENNQGLYYLKNGKDYYEVLFKQATGSNMSVNAAYNYLNDKFDEELATLRDYITNNEENLELIYSPTLIAAQPYNDILNFYLDNYSKDFIEIEDVDVRIETIHPSLEENSSPAMYFISPIDAQVTEVIYVNNSQFSEDPTYAFLTLSHEGVPGHLLQHVTLKNSDLPNIRKYIDYISYSEGWATYVEEFVGKYISIDQELLNAYHINNRLTYLMMCISDIGVNYKGWTKTQLKVYLENMFGPLDESDVDELYYRFIEVPTNALSYYFSYYQLLDLKDKFIEKSNSMKFSNVDYEFHKFYLETGPTPFYILESQIEVYLNEQK